MKRIVSLIFIALSLCSFLNAQVDLPRNLTPAEIEQISHGDFSIVNSDRGIASPPPFTNIRAMGGDSMFNNFLDFLSFDFKADCSGSPNSNVGGYFI